MPRDGKVITASRLDIPIVVTLHDARGSLSWVRAGTESTTLFQQAVSLGPCHDCSIPLTVSLDLSRVPTGRHEIRISANNPDEDPDLSGDQRMFQTWNAQVCVRACTPTYRAEGPVIESRSWYTGVEYQNVSIRSPIDAIKRGGTISIRTGPGSGGEPTVYSAAFIDPDMHNGNAGRIIFERNGPYTGTITIPSDLSPGSHRLVILGSDGQNAAVLGIGVVP